MGEAQKKGSIAILAMIMLSACSSMTEQEAVFIADRFLQEHVKFFTRGSNETDLVKQTSQDYTAYKAGDNWIVVYHITTYENGTEKSADITIEVDSRKAKVTKLNGKSIPE